MPLYFVMLYSLYCDLYLSPSRYFSLSARLFLHRASHHPLACVIQIYEHPLATICYHLQQKPLHLFPALSRCLSPYLSLTHVHGRTYSCSLPC